MKIFDVVRIDMRILGFQSSSSNNKSHILNIASRIFFAADATITLISSIWFFLATAKSFNEYVEVSFYIIHCFLLLTWYAAYLLQWKTYASLILELETSIEKSKIFLSHYLHILFLLKCYFCYKRM